MDANGDGHDHDFPAFDQAWWSSHVVGVHEIAHSQVLGLSLEEIRAVHARDHAAMAEAALSLGQQVRWR